jgi:hypothetical protein
MSWQAMEMVVTRSRIDLAHGRLVMMAIAWRADAEGRNARPTQDWIAAWAKCANGTVRRLIKLCVAAGELTVERGGRENTYHLNFGQPVTARRPASAAAPFSPQRKLKFGRSDSPTVSDHTAHNERSDRSPVSDQGIHNERSDRTLVSDQIAQIGASLSIDRARAKSLNPLIPPELEISQKAERSKPTNSDRPVSEVIRTLEEALAVLSDQPGTQGIRQMLQERLDRCRVRAQQELPELRAEYRARKRAPP